MKKILFMVMSVVLMTFVGCKPDEPLPDADKDVTIVDDNIDPNRSTTVTIYTDHAYGYSTRSVVDEISIYNEKNIKVGTGAYVCDYLVPYNGSIVITYHACDYTHNDVSEKYTDRYQVGTSKQIYICVYAYRSNSSPKAKSYVTEGIDKESNY